MVEELLTDLATNGLLGVLLVIALVAYYRKDQKLTELQAARLEDMRTVKDEYTGLVVRVNTTLDKLIAHVGASR